MSATEFNTVDDFLGHEGSGGGRRGKYLKSWTKNGSIRIWLHTRRMPLAVWQHNLPTLVVFEDRDTRESSKAYYGKPHLCWESEAFLKEQYKREEDGTLEYGEPRKCGICRLIDHVFRGVATGKIDWVTPLLRFEGATDPKLDTTLHAGGITNMFGSDKLTEKQVAFLKAKGIRPSESWRQNMHAKLQYILCIVNDDEPRDGVQIATQNSLVGEAIKKVIRDTQASLGKEEGNPMLHPYCIELTFDERAPINKRYHGRRIERIKLTPDIERMLRDDPPSLTQVTRPFDQRSLRPYLERHAVAPLPWDQIFDVPQLTPPGAEDDEPARDEPARRSAPLEERPAFSLTHAPQSSQEAVGTIPCDRCKAPMREDEDTCKQCGATYDLDEPEAAPAPQPPPTRGKVAGDRIPF